MGSVTLAPGITTVRNREEIFDPCQSGTPAAGQDHFVIVQSNGAVAKLCLDRATPVIFSTLAKQIDMTPARGAPAVDLPGVAAAARVNDETTFNIGTSTPKDISLNLLQAVRDRINAVQVEHPVHCISIGGEGFCSSPAYPEIPWLPLFEATFDIPLGHLSAEQTKIQTQGYRELVVRRYEYGKQGEVQNLFHKFLECDREAAVTFAENLGYHHHRDMADALLADYRQRPQWDDLKIREGRLLLAYMESAIACADWNDPLYHFNYQSLQTAMSTDVHPSLKADIQRSAKRIAEYYATSYRWAGDDRQSNLIQGVNDWCDRTLANIKSSK